MPGHRSRCRQRVQRVADEAGLPVETSERSHLPIGRYAAARNALDDGKNAAMRRGGSASCAAHHWTAEVAWGT